MARPSWQAPGGFTNYGEDPADTATRETAEEAGLKITVSRLLGVYMDLYREPDGTEWPTINHIYLAYLAQPLDPTTDLTQVDANEISDIAWHELLDPHRPRRLPPPATGRHRRLPRQPVTG